jgi:hypothetical protein
MADKITDNRIEKLMGVTGTFAGYFLMLFGAVGTWFSLSGLVLVAAGMFTGFTYIGTIIDYSSRRIKNYTCLFGLIKYGDWHSVNQFDRFRIYKSRRSFTTYSRANIPLTLKSTDIRLDFLARDRSFRITINKFNSFEAARNEMTELIRDLELTEMREWA